MTPAHTAVSGLDSPVSWAADRVADVTVVIPAHQREGVVGRAVASARLQTGLRPREIIVVDDGSTDATADVALSAGARVLRQANAGPGAARNAGIRASTTAWVALLDSDDEWHQHHLTTLWRARGQNVLIGSSAVTTDLQVAGNPHRGPLRLAGPVAAYFPQNRVVTSCTMIRRDALVAVGGFQDFPYAEDLDLWIRLLEAGTGTVLPDLTVTYHVHGAQVTAQVGAAARSARYQVVAQYRNRPWFPPGGLKDLEMLDLWDDVRAGTSGRPGPWRLFRLLTRGPGSMSGMLAQLRYRWALRRASATLDTGCVGLTS